MLINLQAWIRRNFVWVRHHYETFEGFFRAAIRRSRCDRFARKHYRHSACGRYLERDRWEQLREVIRVYERSETDDIWGGDAGVESDEELDEDEFATAFSLSSIIDTELTE